MTFPTIPTVGAGRVLTSIDATVSTTRTSPNLSGLTKNAGDLLIAICLVYQSTGTANAIFSGWTNGFTEFYDGSTTATMATGMAHKWSTGSETGTISVTLAATVTGHAVWILLSIPGAHASTAPVGNTRNFGTTAAALSNALTPSWGADDTLWIAVGGCGEDAITGSWTGMGATAPTNFGSLVGTATPDNSVVGQVDGAVAFRQTNQATQASSQTFAAVDISNARNVIHMVAVRPAPAGTNYTGSPADPVGLTDAVVLDRGETTADPVGITDQAIAYLGPGPNVILRNSIAGASAANAQFTLPKGIEADDIALVTLYKETTNAVTPASGFAEKTPGPTAGGPVAQHTFWKRLTAGESGTINFTWTGSVFREATLRIIRGATPTGDPIEQYTSGTTSGLSINVSLGASSANSLLYAAMTSFNTPSTFTQPSGFSEEYDGDDLGDAIKRNPSGGATGTLTYTVDNSGGGSTAVLLSIAPAGGSTDYDKTPADPVGVTDQATAVQDNVRSQADTVGITDSAAAVQAMQRSQADPVGITDQVTATLSKDVSQADPVGITDQAAAVQDLVRAVADPVGITDQTVAVQALDRIRPDPVGITDSVTAVLSKDVSQSDPVGITDQASAEQALARSLADPVGITDQATAQQANVRSLADPVGITDAVTAVLSKDVTQTDPVGITDATAIEQGRNPSDQVGITDAAAAQQALDRNRNDSVGITDQVTLARSTAPADPVGITDQVTWTMDRERTVSDSIGITDQSSADFAGDLNRFPNDPVGITDQVTATLSKDVAQSDPVGITDQVVLERSKLQNDPVGITDSVTWTMSISRTVADSVGLTDATALNRGKFIADPVGITDSVSKVADLVRSIADQVGISDLADKAQDLFVEIADLLGITDARVLDGTVIVPPPPPPPPPYVFPTSVRAKIRLGGDRTVWLRTDPEFAADVTAVLGEAPLVHLKGDPSYVEGFTARLDGDGPGILLSDASEENAVTTDQLLVTFTIRARTKTGYDVDGNPTFEWNDLLTEIALSWEQRQEFDDVAGITYTRGTILINNPGDVAMTESVVAIEQPGGEVWKVKKVVDHPE